MLDLLSLRALFSVIPQDPFIFEGSLRLNIDPLKQFTIAEISEIVEQVGVDKFPFFQANKLDTQISQMGGNLSTGEKQMISICRGAIRKAELILIDEPTSNIDKESEEIITKTLKKVFRVSASMRLLE